MRIEIMVADWHNDYMRKFNFYNRNDYVLIKPIYYYYIGDHLIQV